MPYPPRANTNKDFALDDQQGAPVDGTALSVELANINESVNQILGFIKAGFTSDRKWRPTELVGQEVAYEQRYVAVDAQTDFPIPTTITLDPVADKAVVFVNGAKVDSDDVTVTSTTVTLPPRLAGDIVEVNYYNSEEDLRQQLASTLNAVGASLVGIEDKLGLLSADNVEDALAEIKVQLNQVAAGIGDIQGLIRADGTVAFAANQSMGGFRLTSVGAGIDDDDAVNVQQLNALAAIYGDLGSIFLSLAGGTMSGIINMGGLKIVNVDTGTDAGDAVNVAQLDELALSLAGTYLPTTGGTVTGEINSKANGVAIRVRPAEDVDEPVRKDQVGDLVEEAIGSATLGLVGGTGVLGSYPSDPECACPTFDPDLSANGIFDYQDLTLAADPDMAHMVAIRCTGDLVLTGRTLTLSRDASTRMDLREQLLGPERVVPTDFTPAPGGAGAGGYIFDLLETAGLAGATDMPLQLMQWSRDAFIMSGPLAEAAITPPDARLGRHQGGCLRIHVDGDIYMEGALIEVNGTNQFYEPEDFKVAGGGGGVIIVCRGTIFTGEGGAVIDASGADAVDTQDNGVGGGDGGYVAVVAKRIEGAGGLSIDASGGLTNSPDAGSPKGSGGVVEVLRSEVQTGDVNPAVNVQRGASGSETGLTRDGLSVIATIPENRIPFAGGYV